VDKILTILFSNAMVRKTCPSSEPNLEQVTLALLSLELLGLARSVLHPDGTRSWFATHELEWLASRDYVGI